jgi:hypothetical protein
MQVCTQASGKTASIASGKPDRPSTQAIRTSLDAALVEVVEDREPELRAFCLLPPDPEHLALALERDPEREVAGAVAHRAVLFDLHLQRVEVDDRVDRLERPGAPRGDVSEHGVGDAADRVAADLGAVEIGPVPGDVPDRHAAGVEP